MRKISILGIVVGSITDFVSSFVLLLISLMVFILMNYDISALPDSADIGAAFDRNGSFVFTRYILGALSSMLAGFVSAAIAKRCYVLNGAFSAWGCMLLSICTLAIHPAADVLRLTLAIGASPLFGALGGYLKKPRSA